MRDDMIDLFNSLLQKSGRNARNYIKKQFSNISEIKKVYSKNELLYKIAQACINYPEGKINKHIFPSVPEAKFVDIINEYLNKKNASSFSEVVHKRARSSYVCHYRRMLERILNLFEFNANNDSVKTFLDAIALIKEYSSSRVQYFPEGVDIPIKGVIKKSQKKLIISKENKEKINRIDYEICVLKNLRDKLKYKEIWIEGTNKYRNPEKDLPQDYDNNKDFYYELLNKPQNASEFIRELKELLNKQLFNFNDYLKNSQKVKVLTKPEGHIYVAKSKAQKSPEMLDDIKNHILALWPSTNLLDILKEADLYVNFTNQFLTSGASEKIDKDELQRRILLTIFSYGTNTGLKRVSSGNTGVSYDDLKYTKERYLDKDNLRYAISMIANKIFKIKNKEIWGETTTALISDSKIFSSWDQNLLTQWHPRYNRSGVMIYWHVDKKATCVYSQLKTCLSSEVASMFQGVLHHCTDMNVKKNYADTHGGSVVGFAFSYLLDFELLVRFKNIHAQKLYISDDNDIEKYQNIKPAVSGSINWDLIEEHYDHMIKYASALKQGTADASAILRPFARKNYTHPIYQALCELGKAIKTIFLCRYLSTEKLRLEIHESLNVVERWNSVNSFIFYGRSGEICFNQTEEQELSVLSLHLLQMSMVYINTLMIQQVLKNKNLIDKLSIEDKRAINPLGHEHINPYGLFHLDLSLRLNLEYQYLSEVA